MTDRCEPPPELRGVDGWHWVQVAQQRVPLPAWWNAEAVYWHADGMQWDTADAHDLGWRYLYPAATPTEVEALRAERDAFNAMADRYAEENITLRARVAELEKVVALYQAEVGAFTGRGTTLARLMEIDGLARAALSAETP